MYFFFLFPAFFFFVCFFFFFLFFFDYGFRFGGGDFLKDEIMVLESGWVFLRVWRSFHGCGDVREM